MKAKHPDPAKDTLTDKQPYPSVPAAAAAAYLSVSEDVDPLCSSCGKGKFHAGVISKGTKKKTAGFIMPL